MIRNRGCYIRHQSDEGGENTDIIACKQDGYAKLHSYDWLKDIPGNANDIEYVEVRFKNTRKSIYYNQNNLRLDIGDIVAVEASPGHDIGVVSLIGELVNNRLRADGVDIKNAEFKRIYRKAKPADIDKWKEAIDLEHTTMLGARKIAEDLKLNMKIGDVEYQGDKTKAIFYYIADERVDFRELIKILADRFKIRIEMRQIGARQEAGRIGGIGACGRELCCSTWITNFVSVTTNAARFQEVSLNPQKLAGQCSKLKCCINYEIDAYMDAQLEFPDRAIALETMEGTAYHQKTDIFKGIMWYSFDREIPVNLTPISVERVRQIQQINKKGEKPNKLGELAVGAISEPDYMNVVGQESLDRFKKPDNNTNKRKKKRKPKRKPPRR